MGQLPEFTSPAELYYDNKESLSYNKNTRITKIQKEITLRAVELLKIEMESPLIINLGCGGGLCGQVLNEFGYQWMGVDISKDMLKIADESTSHLGLIKSDIGEEIPFKEESFDYAISISAVQWLFQSYKTEHIPMKRIRTFFKSLYTCVRIGVAIQFYCGKKETQILKTEAAKAGFYGGLVVDNEGTKNSKHFLVLTKLRPEKIKDVSKFSRKSKKKIRKF